MAAAQTTSLIGTLFFMDIHYRLFGKVSCASDIYGVGITLLQLMTSSSQTGHVTGHTVDLTESSTLHLLDKRMDCSNVSVQVGFLLHA